MNKYKLAILTSHPIQYQGPLFQLLAKQPEIDLTVYFCWDFGIKKEGLDAGFGKKIKWDIPLMEGYKYKFFKNFSLRSSSGFWGQINPGIIIELIKNCHDAILVYGWNSFSNWLVFMAAFLSGLPVLLHSENPLNQELLKPKWKIYLKKLILKPLFKTVSAFLYIGEENRRFYKYYGVPDEKLFFVPYAVDNERFMAANNELRVKKHELRKRLNMEQNAVVILFVGKLIEKKRPMDLLLAYERLITVNYNKLLSITPYLLFVGDGKLRPELERYVEERKLKDVHFVGFKNQTELPEYYAIADVFVLSSGPGETWGLVVNEAMCFGLPIIVSDIVGCARDLARPNENGFIFPLSDVKKLARYLADLAGDSEKRKDFSEKSFEVVQNYSYKEDIGGILKALNSLRQ